MKNNLTAANILSIKSEAQKGHNGLAHHSKAEIAIMTENLAEEVIGILAERAASCELLETFVYFTPILSGTCFVMYANRTWKNGAIQLGVDTRKEINFTDFLNVLSQRGFDFSFGPSDYWRDEETKAQCVNTVRVYVKKVEVRH